MEEVEVGVIEEMDDFLILSMVYEVIENCDKGQCNKNLNLNVDEFNIN